MKLARLSAGITQRDASVKLNVDESTVSKWETGIAKPRAERLLSMAALYKCTLDALLKPDDE